MSGCVYRLVRENFFDPNLLLDLLVPDLLLGLVIDCLDSSLDPPPLDPPPLNWSRPTKPSMSGFILLDPRGDNILAALLLG